jgi:hypothetical protein
MIYLEFCAILREARTSFHEIYSSSQSLCSLIITIDGLQDFINGVYCIERDFTLGYVTSNLSHRGLRKENKSNEYQGQSDWNHEAVKQAELKNTNIPPGILGHQAGKTLAEMAFWDFFKNNAGKIGFDGVAVLPSFVTGGSNRPDL